MRHVLGYGAALCLLVLILCQSIIFPSFFMPFFRQQFNRTYERHVFNRPGEPPANVPLAEAIHMDFDELMHVTTELLDYMRGRRDNLYGIRAVVDGVQRGPAEEGYQEFFGPREIDHMVDVRVLYDRLYIVRNVAFFGLIGLLAAMALLKYNVLHLLARCSREIMAGFLGLGLILVGLVALDFDRAFEIFHLILFNNDYWLLNPQHHLLINIVPIEFFVSIAIFIGALMSGIPLLVIIVNTLYLRWEKRRTGLSFGGSS